MKVMNVAGALVLCMGVHGAMGFDKDVVSFVKAHKRLPTRSDFVTRPMKSNGSFRWFSETSLKDLSGANLSGANFSRANLSGANLTGVDLTKVSFYRVNLAGADLTGSCVYSLAKKNYVSVTKSWLKTTKDAKNVDSVKGIN